MIVGTICAVGGTISVLAYEEYRTREAIKDISQAFGNIGGNIQGQSEEQQAKVQAQMLMLQKEKEEKQLREAELERQAREIKLAQVQAEIEQHQAEEQKKTQFTAEFKPRPECNDPNLEWTKFVQCSNEKIRARQKFNKSH
jgi:hypothetical protein